MYSSCGGGGLRCNVLYRRHSLNFQYPHCVKPLEVLTSLCVGPRNSAPFFLQIPCSPSRPLLRPALCEAGRAPEEHLLLHPQLMQPRGRTSFAFTRGALRAGSLPASRFTIYNAAGHKEILLSCHYILLPRPEHSLPEYWLPESSLPVSSPVLSPLPVKRTRKAVKQRHAKLLWGGGKEEDLHRSPLTSTSPLSVPLLPLPTSEQPSPASTPAIVSTPPTQLVSPPLLPPAPADWAHSPLMSTRPATPAPWTDGQVFPAGPDLIIC